MKKQAGFTLIELMVVLAVTGIMLGFGVPRLTAMLQTNRIVASLNSLSAHLNYARSEAIKRSTCVTVIPLNPVGWELGWEVYVDFNCNGIKENNETQLRIVDALNIPNVTIIPTDNFVIYNRLGASVKKDGVAAANTFTLSGYGDDKELKISTTGHVSIP